MRKTKLWIGMIVLLINLLITPEIAALEIENVKEDILYSLLNIESASFSIPYKSMTIYMDVYKNNKDDVETSTLFAVRHNETQINTQHNLLILPVIASSTIYNLIYSSGPSSTIVQYDFNNLFPIEKGATICNWYRASELTFNETDEAILYIFTCNIDKSFVLDIPNSIFYDRDFKKLLDLGNEIVGALRVKVEER